MLNREDIEPFFSIDEWFNRRGEYAG